MRGYTRRAATIAAMAAVVSAGMSMVPAAAAPGARAANHAFLFGGHAARHVLPWSAVKMVHGRVPGTPVTRLGGLLESIASPGSAPTLQVGANPVGELVDQRTHTLYVANGGSNTVSVISTATCNAQRSSGCAQNAPTVAAGPGPLALALDTATNTLYATDLGGGSGDTVSLIDAATCNAIDHAGCDQVPPQATVGPGPTLLALDQHSHTIYVPDSSGDTVSMLNVETCNAGDTSGCSASTVQVGSGPNAVTINPRTHTAYVENFNDGTVSVIDTATCNATSSGGCAGPLPEITLGAGTLPDAAAVDEPSDTVYVPTGGPSLGSLALINGATCNASVTLGCGQTPARTRIGSAPIWITENPVTRTVYSVNEEDSSVSVIDAASCNATDTAGCRRVPPALATGFNAGADAVDTVTDTVYVSSQNNGTVTVLDGATCNAYDTRGCSHYAPTTPVGNGPQPIAVDPGTHTIYVGSMTDGTVSVVNAAICNVEHPSGCDHTWPTITVGFPVLFGLALNPATHTLYVSNLNSDTLAVINTATCKAGRTGGCGQTPGTVTVGNAPAGIAIDRATDTVYVADAADNTVSVVDGARCNAEVLSSVCSHAPPTVATGTQPVPVGLDSATDTLYVGNQVDDTVSVIDTATCNAKTTGGCGQTAPTVTIADAPYGLAVDEQNDTVYVANTGLEAFITGYANLTSSVSVIRGATCNASVTTGCASSPATVPVGGFPWDVAIDPVTQTVYVTSIVDSDVARFNAATCNGATAADCHVTVLSALTGGWPQYLGIDTTTDTLYVNNNTSGDLSLFSLRSK